MMECTEALERLSLRPDVDGTADPVLARHLAICPPCADEAAFMARVARVRAEPPAGMVEAILARTGGRYPGFGWWSSSVAAAAVLILALGAGLISQQLPSADGPFPFETFLAQDLDEWEGDDWYVAGAPVLEGLPDQMLLALLQEESW
jgi:hypothetical protein